MTQIFTTIIYKEKVDEIIYKAEMEKLKQV